MTLKQLRKHLFKKIPYSILAILLCVVVLFFAVTLRDVTTITTQNNAAIVAQAQSESLGRIYANTYLLAHTAVVYDVTDKKVLYSLNAYTPEPLASISKIMTALVGKTVLPQNQPIIITKADRTDSPDYTLRDGDTWTANDLTQYSLVKSSNDGITAVCNAVTAMVQKTNSSNSCVSLMNQYAVNQGLKTLYFVNPSGLDRPDTTPSNFGSAFDVAQLLGNAYTSYPMLFEATREPTLTFHTNKFTYTAENTDEDLNKIAHILAGKTGYTTSAGGNLAILYSPTANKQVAIVVLGSSHDGRFSDMLELVRRTNIYMNVYGK